MALVEGGIFHMICVLVSLSVVNPNFSTVSLVTLLDWILSSVIDQLNC